MKVFLLLLLPFQMREADSIVSFTRTDDEERKRKKETRCYRRFSSPIHLSSLLEIKCFYCHRITADFTPSSSFSLCLSPPSDVHFHTNTSWKMNRTSRSTQCPRWTLLFKVASLSPGDWHSCTWCPYLWLPVSQTYRQRRHTTLSTCYPLAFLSLSLFFLPSSLSLPLSLYVPHSHSPLWLVSTGKSSTSQVECRFLFISLL